MAAAVSFKVVDQGSRRVVAVAPAGRPDLHLPRLHPARTARPGRVGSVASCASVRPAPVSAWLRVKVAVVGLLALSGAAVSVAQFVSMAQTESVPAGTSVADFVAEGANMGYVSQP